MTNASIQRPTDDQAITHLRTTDYRDLVIEELVTSEAELLARVRDLEGDVISYRLLAQESLTMLHRLTVERDQLRRRLKRLAADLRWLREQQRTAA
jgi:hypothetical protein